MIKYTKSFLKKLNKENIIGKFFEENKIIAILKQEAEWHFKHSISNGEAYELLKKLEKDGIIITIIITKEKRTTGVIADCRIEKRFKVYGINKDAVEQKDGSQYLTDFFTEESLKKLDGTLTSVDDILENFAQEIRNETPDEFKRYLKAACNDEVVLVSVRSAMRLEDNPENFSEIEVLRRVANEIINNDKELTKNALTFLEYWKNNYKNKD